MCDEGARENGMKRRQFAQFTLIVPASYNENMFSHEINGTQLINLQRLFGERVSGEEKRME